MLPPPAANFSSQRFRVQIRIACELRPVDYHTAAKRLRRSCDNAMPWAQALAVLTNPIYARHSPWISRAASPDNDDGGDGGGASASTTSEGAAEQANLRGLPLFYVGDIHSVVERDERGRVAPSVRNSIYFMWDLFMLYDVFQVYRSMYAAWKPFKRAFRETTELVGCKRALERSGTIQTAAGLKALLSPDGAASDGNMPLCMLHGRIALQASAAATASASATDGALRQAVLKFETVEKCWRPFHPLFGLFSSGERPAGGVASSRGGRSTYLRETLSTSLDEDIKAFKVVDGTGEVVLPLQHVLKCPEKIDFTTLGCEVKASSIGPSSITKVGPLNHVPHVEYTKGALLEGTDVTLVGRFGASPAIVTASAPNSSGGEGGAPSVAASRLWCIPDDKLGMFIVQKLPRDILEDLDERIWAQFWTCVGAGCTVLFFSAVLGFLAYGVGRDMYRRYHNRRFLGGFMGLPQDLLSRDSDEEDATSEGNDGMLPEGEGCCICLTRRRKIVLVPCGHRCVCKQCAVSLMTYAWARAEEPKCPICREVVHCTQRCYL